MKEYDLDAYSRKWRGTAGLFRTKDGQTHQGLYDEFFSITRNRIGVQVIQHFNGYTETKKYSVECDSEGYEPMEILYAPVKSGWYKREVDSYGLLTRKHTRAFQVGVCTSSHLCMADIGNFAMNAVQPSTCKFLEPAVGETYDAGKAWGILNFRLWWRNQKLMYLNQCIGLFAAGNVLMLEDADYLPHVKPYLGDQCQITF